MKHFILIAFLVSGWGVKGQNLVPDPGFEIFSRIPGPDSPDNSISTCTYYWCTTGESNSRYIYKPADKTKQLPFAHSGNGSIELNTGKQRCFLQTELKSTLIKGRIYRVTIHVKGIGPEMLNPLGAFFAEQRCFDNSGLLKNRPSISSFYIAKSEKDWIKITGTYIATGKENVLVLGDFRKDVSKGEFKFFLDDISVEEVSSTTTNSKDLSFKE